MNINNLKRYLPTILSFVACGGVIGTSILAVKNQKKVEEELKEKGTNKFYAWGESEPILFNNDELTKKDILMIYVKHHFTTALSGIGTMACILSSNSMNRNTQAALVSAYGLLNESYNEYRGKLIELHGPEAHKEIINAIAVEKSHPIPLGVNGTFTESSLEGAQLAKNDADILFYDVFSKRFFTSKLANVIEAEYHLNRNFCLGADVALNEWYEFLGIEQTIEGNELGWCMGSNELESIMWLDFDHKIAHLDDGTPYVQIFMEFEPSLDWEEAWQ